MRRFGAGQLHTALLGLILGAGILLRLIQYLANRPLWMDEAMLAVNIVERSFGELLEPLEHYQVAPLGFLFAERLAVALLGSSELALRLFPLLAGIGALFLFWQVARRTLPPGSALVALLLFALSTRMIYYAAELKQYSSDVAAALLLLLLTLWIRVREVTWSRATGLGMAGGLLVWFSQPIVFILAGLFTGMVALYARERRWPELRRLTGGFLLWAVIGIPALLFSLQGVDAETRAGLRSYWESGFMPLPPRSLEEALWLPQALQAFARESAGFRWPLLALLLAVAGCAWLLRQRSEILLFLILPFGFTLLASALRIYPFALLEPDGYWTFTGYTGRVLLFLVPAFLLLIAAGLEYLRQRLPRRLSFAPYLLLPLLLLHPVRALLNEFPYEHDDVRSLVHYLAEHWRPDERIWVYWGAGAQFHYDAMRLGLPRDTYHLASWVSPGQGATPEDLEHLQRPGHVWLVFAQPFGALEAPTGDRAAVLRWLEKRGVPLRQLRSREASLHLYQIGEPARNDP